MIAETPILFRCGGVCLLGTLHATAGAGEPRRGLVMVVGGPQYRAGSHRQYVLLARFLAERGTPVFRFDYRGLGDSDGDYRGFEHIGEDIRAAIDQFFERVPSLHDVVLWGLCDAASAILMYSPKDPRVAGIVVLNPWVRSSTSLARVYLLHYYPRRLLGRDFWRKVFAGGLNPFRTARSIADTVQDALGARPQEGSPASMPDTLLPAPADASAPLAERMADGLRRYQGRVLLVMSGKDLTAREFDDVVSRSRRWRALLRDARITRLDLAECDHTFSRRAWRDQLAELTREWLASW